LSVAGFCVALLSARAGPAYAQPSQPTPDPASSGRQTTLVAAIDVVAPREPGAVAGLAPIFSFSPADITGYGASNVADLLAALGPEARGPDGSAPVLLLNGVRISSVAQVGSLPPEALQGCRSIPATPRCAWATAQSSGS
jgi:hypothetical protein